MTEEQPTNKVRNNWKIVGIVCLVVIAIALIYLAYVNIYNNAYNNGAKVGEKGIINYNTQGKFIVQVNDTTYNTLNCQQLNITQSQFGLIMGCNLQ